MLSTIGAKTISWIDHDLDFTVALTYSRFNFLIVYL
jgi:hypothetical protein